MRAGGNARACADWLAFNRALYYPATTLLRARQFAGARFDVFRAFNIWGSLDVTRLGNLNRLGLIVDQFAIDVGGVLRLVGVKRLSDTHGTTLDQGDTRNSGG